MTKRLVLSALCALALAPAFGGSASAATGLDGVRIIGKPMTKQQLTKQQQARISSCRRGEFCGWRHKSMAGGLFHHSGSDRNLWNDKFENHDTNVLVASEISSVFNNGYNTANADDVLAFEGGHDPLRWCIPNGYWATYIYAMNDKIDGYYWTNCDGR
jgi:hypothetical protein